jgi:hypothetical protein
VGAELLHFARQTEGPAERRMYEQKGGHDEVVFLNYTYKSASEVLHSVNRVYLCVLYVSQEKQRLRLAQQYVTRF